MTNEEEVRQRIANECQPNPQKAVEKVIEGAVEGAITAAPGGYQAAGIGAALGAAVQATKTVIEQGKEQNKCIEKIKETPPPPVVFTRPKPVNVNANYLISVQASRNKVMFRGSVRI